MQLQPNPIRDRLFGQVVYQTHLPPQCERAPSLVIKVNAEPSIHVFVASIAFGSFYDFIRSVGFYMFEYLSRFVFTLA